jgi:cytochrome c oxidase subunit 4
MSTEHSPNTSAIPANAAHGEHEHGGPKIYTRNLLALLILTIITVGASYIDFGPANVVIALVIASIKATLVALIFMHLLYEKKINAVIAGAGFLFLGIFIMFCLLDTDSRVNLQPVNAKIPVAAPAAAAPPKE